MLLALPPVQGMVALWLDTRGWGGVCVCVGVCVFWGSPGAPLPSQAV